MFPFMQAKIKIIFVDLPLKINGNLLKCLRCLCIFITNSFFTIFDLFSDLNSHYFLRLKYFNSIEFLAFFASFPFASIQAIIKDHSSNLIDAVRN
jgi:hypothetical protein